MISSKLFAILFFIILAEFSSGIYSSAQEVQGYILQTFGIEYSLSAVRLILEKLNFVYKKTSEVPSNFDEAEQDAFLEQLVPFLKTSTATKMNFNHSSPSTSSDLANLCSLYSRSKPLCFGYTISISISQVQYRSGL